jgi:uncharacterized membrane protein YkoI
MKELSILIIALVSLFIISCDQQNVNIPEKVQASFDELFPLATEVEWEMEDENEWEAEFEMDGKEASACFTSEGEWLETEYEVESLPETIETIINETYPGFEISEIEMIESAEFNGYEVELEMNEEEMEILVSMEGEIIEVEMEEDED